MTHPTRCPVHAAPEDGEFDAWPCPDYCEFFAAELDRRIHDVSVNGNYWRTWDEDGVRYMQQYKNHEPVGESKPMLRRDRES